MLPNRSTRSYLGCMRPSGRPQGELLFSPDHGHTSMGKMSRSRWQGGHPRRCCHFSVCCLKRIKLSFGQCV